MDFHRVHGFLHGQLFKLFEMTLDCVSQVDPEVLFKKVCRISSQFTADAPVKRIEQVSG